jgi:hypothetical protein
LKKHTDFLFAECGFSPGLNTSSVRLGFGK